MTRHKADLPKHFQSVHVAGVRNQHPLQMTQPHFVFEGTSCGFSAVNECGNVRQMRLCARRGNRRRQLPDIREQIAASERMAA
jgi:hypothetical protein